MRFRSTPILQSLRFVILLVTILSILGCNPVQNRIRTLRGIYDIPQCVAKEDNPHRLWTDLYLEDSTIVFIYKESKETYLNGIWGEDFKELSKIVESEYLLSYGYEELKSKFLDVDISSYNIREILLDYNGEEICSYEYEISSLKPNRTHRIAEETLKRLIELSALRFPIPIIEGVQVQKATWNEAENRIDFELWVKYRTVDSKTNPELKRGMYYDYDEESLREHIENNWDNIFWGLSSIIRYNNIVVAFHVDNQGEKSTLLYHFPK